MPIPTSQHITAYLTVLPDTCPSTYPPCASPMLFSRRLAATSRPIQAHPWHLDCLLARPPARCHTPPRHHLSSRHPLADPANTRPFRLTNTQPTTHLTQTWVGFCFFEKKIVTHFPDTKILLSSSLTTAHSQSFFQVVLKPYLHGHQGSFSKA